MVVNQKGWRNAVKILKRQRDRAKAVQDKYLAESVKSQKKLQQVQELYQPFIEASKEIERRQEAIRQKEEDLEEFNRQVLCSLR